MRLAAAVGVALVLAAPAAAGTREVPVEVRAIVTPATVLFGEPATLVVTAAFDPRAVDESSVSVEADVFPLRRLGRPATARREADGLVVLTQRTRVVCAGEACRPARGLRRVELPPVRVRAGALAAAVERPSLLVASRVPPEAASAEPAWRVDATPPAVTYRTTPSLHTAHLCHHSAALLHAAAAQVAGEVVRARRQRRVERLSELEAALVAVRASLDADEPERRRAVGALARVLEGRADAHEARAAALAWDEPRPERDRVAALADEVERDVRA